MLERLAKSNGEKIKIVKVDVDASENWARSENIKNLPTIQFFRAGNKVHQVDGTCSEQEMQEKIDKYLTAGDGGETLIKPMPKDWLPPGVTRK